MTHGFRDVLNEWAHHQLTRHSRHTGPFTDITVHIEMVCGYSVENDYLQITIGFTHPQDCPECLEEP